MIFYEELCYAEVLVARGAGLAQAEGAEYEVVFPRICLGHQAGYAAGYAAGELGQGACVVLAGLSAALVLHIRAKVVHVGVEDEEQAAYDGYDKHETYERFHTIPF